MRPLPTALAIAVPILAVTFGPAPARAQEAPREEVRKAIEEARKSLAADLDKALAESTRKLAAEILKISEQRTAERLAKLEEMLKERDKKIADLEAKLAARPATAPAVPVPAPAAASAAFLGVAHQDLPPDLKEKFKVEKGALVTRVIDGSPAAAAGIQTGDVLLSVNGMEVTSGNLRDVVASFPVGQEVNVTYLRDGNKVTKSAKLGDAAKLDVAAKPKEEAKREPVKLGLEVEEDGALVVLAVEEGHTGSLAGLAKGDKITQVNGKEVKTIEEIGAELKKVLHGDKLTISYLRPGDKEDIAYVASVVGAAGKEGGKLISREEKKIAREAKPAEKKKALLGISVIPDPEGVKVSVVEPDTAAQAAGIEKGDIVRKLNGEAVPDVAQLSSVLGKLSPGDKVSFELSRGGKTVEVKDVVLRAEGDKVAAAPKPEEKPAAKPEEKPAEKPKKPGKLKIHAMDNAAGDQVTVSHVEKDGAGDKAGLKNGDIVLQVNDKKIRNTEDLAAALKPFFAGDPITIKVRRGSEEKEIKATLGEAAPENAPKA